MKTILAFVALSIAFVESSWLVAQGTTAAPRPKAVAALTQIGVFQRTVERFSEDMGRYPTTDEGLAVLVKAPVKDAVRWKGPYLKYDLPTDPWGNPYHYRFPAVKSSAAFDIWSSGPDGIESSDDVGNWDHF
jgi:general secretion pathway protein G